MELSNIKQLILFLIFFNLSQTSAQVYPDSSIDRNLKDGIKLIVNQNYDDATKLFSQLNQNHPDLPLGKIYLAATLIAKSYDYKEPYDDDAITKYLESSKNLSDNLLNKDDENIWNNYFYALAQGYGAYYDALNGSWMVALSSGFNSMSAFEYCLDQDKNFYEALIAIGSYKFWRSKKTEDLNWLPFLPDEKQIGINYLNKAIQYSGYNSYLAVYSLIWIYIEQREFDKAISIAESALKKNPDSRMFKWGLARAYESENPEKSINLYNEILSSYPKTLKSNYINEVILKHLMAQQLVKIGKKSAALNLCNDILSIEDYNPYELERLKERLDRVRGLKNVLNKQ